MKFIKSTRIIGYNKTKRYIDAQSSTLAVVENSPGKKPNIKNPVSNYGTRQNFYKPEYDLVEIGAIEDIESLVRQAFQKKSALMFKEGEKFAGKNQETIAYIKSRIQQIEYVSGRGWRDLLRETGYALITRSNYFWVKARNEDASGGRAIGNMKPIAAYFGMGAEHVKIQKDKNGKITKYRQQMPDGRFVEFNPSEIIHFHAHRKPGFLFGTPYITPVKDDIRALRRIEENVELLIYQTLFPIFHYKVGTEMKPAGDIRLGDGSMISEVDYVRGQIAQMPAEGGIVTPERHSIEYIGADKATMKAREYLDYFKQRVLSGLAISGVDIGEGDTANRATSDSMSKALVDSVKDYQDVLEDFIDREVFQELLLESTFSFDVLAEENIVKFRFQEVDIEEQMKQNTNAQVLFNGNIINVDEARLITGREPIRAEDEPLMFHNRVTMPTAQLAVDAQIQVASMKPDVKAPKSKSAASAKNSNAPTNQYGTKSGPQSSRTDFKSKDSYASNATRALKADLVDHVSKSNISRDWMTVLINQTKGLVLDKYTKITQQAFAEGLSDARLDNGMIDKLTMTDYPEVKKFITKVQDKYFKDITGKLHRGIDKLIGDGAPRKDISDSISQVIDSIKYRADFFDKTERMRAYNYGKAIGLASKGYTSANLSKTTDCEKCKELDYKIDLTSFDIESIPPFHPNSVAKITTGIS